MYVQVLEIDVTKWLWWASAYIACVCVADAGMFALLHDQLEYIEIKIYRDFCRSLPNLNADNNNNNNNDRLTAFDPGQPG